MSTFQSMLADIVKMSPTIQNIDDFVTIITYGPVVYMVWLQDAESGSQADSFCTALYTQVNQAYNDLSKTYPQLSPSIWTISNLSLGLIPMKNTIGINHLAQTLRKLQKDGHWAGSISFVEQSDMLKRLSVGMVGIQLDGYKKADDIYVSWNLALQTIRQTNPELADYAPFWDTIKQSEQEIMDAHIGT